MATHKAEYRIRECNDRRDAHAIHRLIYGLAEYEREPESMKTTVADFERDGFDTQPPLFFATLAECRTDTRGDESGTEWTAVGISLYFTSYSSWVGKCLYLEDIFVDPAHRGNGLGDRLMRHTARVALRMDCARLQWVVLDWNSSASEFYKKRGAHDLKQWKLMRFDRKGLEDVVQGDETT